MNDVEMETRALVIAAKAPAPGTAKTRLGRTVGHDRAAALYHAFLQDLGARFRFAHGWDVFWAVSPTSAGWAGIIGTPVRAFVQEGADWTARQRYIFAWTATRGYTETVLIASDSPQLDRTTVRAAFRGLDAHVAVLLPTYDGGYSLIGQRAGVDILGTTPMSTGTVFDDLRATARMQGHALATLPPTWDIDEEGDLAWLTHYLAGAHDAPATARAFTRLGFAGMAQWQMTGAALRAGGVA